MTIEAKVIAHSVSHRGKLPRTSVLMSWVRQNGRPGANGATSESGGSIARSLIDVTRMQFYA